MNPATEALLIIARAQGLPTAQAESEIAALIAENAKLKKAVAVLVETKVVDARRELAMNGETAIYVPPANEAVKLAALTYLLEMVRECKHLGDFKLREQINTALALYDEATKGQ